MRNDISGRWSGIYYYSQTLDVDMPPVPYEAKFQQFGNTIRGEITEENTFAPTGGSILVAHVNGYVVGGIVGFTKTYNNGANASHTIDYHGYITGKGKIISGHWQIEDWSGTFSMYRETGSKRPFQKAVIKQVANV